MSRSAIRSALNRVGSARLRHFFHDLGPGLITGAADDDPSGISTYSVAGAAFGYAQLWIALVSFPLMAAVQLMCARLGMVTGLGLASVVRRRYSRAVLWGACLLLLVANTVNVGADLGGMAEAMQMVSGISSYFWLPLRSEEHTSELQSLAYLVCRLLLEKKKTQRRSVYANGINKKVGYMQIERTNP